MRKTLRRLLGGALIAAGAVGILLPIVPGIPLLLAGLVLLGPGHAWLDTLRARLRAWRPKRDRPR